MAAGGTSQDQADAFSTVLRRFRVLAGLSQEELAARAGVSARAIGTLEQGLHRRPYPHTVIALAEALALTPSEREAFLASTRASQRAGRAQALEPDDVEASRLPVWLTSFIGREVEVDSVRALVDPAGEAVRLLTLLGPGGVGKTRLALAVATAVAGDFPNGVVFVDLAPLHDDRLIPATIAGALGVHASGGQSARELAFAYLKERTLLLVLDNCEHLLGGSRFVGELLVVCPRVSVLATSRTTLRLRAERRFLVEPLAPPVGESPSMDTIAASPAVRLFVARAQMAAPEFALEAGNAAIIGAICSRLDGMPLAIELAAARVGLLGPKLMLQRLDRQLELLTSGAADLPERQRTLSNTLAWSYDLLQPAERTLLRRVAAFAGGWTLSAAESVCSNGNLASEAVLEHLQTLVENSLIRRLDTNEDEPRFAMLESVREYAATKLIESGEYDALRTRHADWCLGLAEQAVTQLIGPQQMSWLERLDRALDNLRLALAWLYEQQQTELGLRLVGALARFWLTRRHVAEGRDWVERFLAQANADAAGAAVRARAYYAAGILANTQGDQQLAGTRLEQSIELYHLAGDTVGAVRALNTRGGVVYDQGQLAFAAALWEQTLVQARAAGDIGEASHALGNLGEAHYHMGDVEGAATRHTDALALARQAGRTDVESMQLGNLGNVARTQGDLARATALHRQALLLKRDLGARRQIAITLADHASIAGVQGRGARAARLIGAATALRELLGTPQPVPERADMERAVAQARTDLGEDAWSAELLAGREMSMEQAIDYALE